MASRGVDEVLMPGQVAALQKRIEVLVPDRERRLRDLQAATEEAASISKAGGDSRGAERALKRAARLRSEAAAITNEMATLESLVAARLAQSPRPY
ncbi:MAG: hypothetical protein WAT58_09695 [Candidatus Dormiibacterota bacterium]